MKKVYAVTVDYLTTCTINVLAEDAERAESRVVEMFEDVEGQRFLMKKMAANVPDGLEIAMVEEATPDWDIIAE